MPRNPTRRGQVRHGRGGRALAPTPVARVRAPCTPRPRPWRAVEHLEDRFLLSVTRDANGFTVPTPEPDSHVYYVSAAGSDNNNGTSPASPFPTIAKARTLLRNGFPDYVLLRRGDTFTTPITGWAISGRSADEPMVIGAYTDPNRPSDDRPRINTGTSTGFANQATSSNHPLVSHLYLMGIAFEADLRNYRQPPATGRQHQLQFRRGRRDLRGQRPRPDERLPHRGLLVPVLPHRAWPSRAFSGWGNPTDVRAPPHRRSSTATRPTTTPAATPSPARGSTPTACRA